MGKEITVEVSQGLTGYTLGDEMITMTQIDQWRAAKKLKLIGKSQTIGMPTKGSEVATSNLSG